MVSSTQFFLIGYDSGSPSCLHMYKITFSYTVVDWANKILNSSGNWVECYSESILNADSSVIYSFFIFASSSNYLYFAALSAASGNAVSTRYKSSVTVNNAYGSALNGDYVINLNTYNLSTILAVIKNISIIFVYKLFKIYKYIKATFTKTNSIFK